MKIYFISIFILLTGFCHSQNLIVTSKFIAISLDDELKIIDKKSMSIVYKSEIDSRSSAQNLFISADSSKIWYQNSFDYFCLDTKTWKAEKKMSGTNVFAFNPSSGNRYCIHSENYEDQFTSTLYDANTGELYKKVSYPANAFLSDVAFDEKTGLLYQLSRNYSSETESDQTFDFPENAQEVEQILRNDGEESELVVYDVTNDKIIVQKSIYYSPQSACDFAFIKGYPYFITSLGSAKIESDFSLTILPMAPSSSTIGYTVIESTLIGFSFFEVFKMDCSTMSFSLPEELHDDILTCETLSAAADGKIYFLKGDVILVFQPSDFLNTIQTIEIPE